MLHFSDTLPQFLKMKVRQVPGTAQSQQLHCFVAGLETVCFSWRTVSEKLQLATEVCRPASWMDPGVGLVVVEYFFDSEHGNIFYRSILAVVRAS